MKSSVTEDISVIFTSVWNRICILRFGANRVVSSDTALKFSHYIGFKDIFNSVTLNLTQYTIEQLILFILFLQFIFWFLPHKSLKEAITFYIKRSATAA